MQELFGVFRVWEKQAQLKKTAINVGIVEKL